MDYTILVAELTNDPLPRGYAGMTDAQRLASLRVKDRPTERSIVAAYEVLEAIVPSEWAALTAQEKQRVQTFTSAGQVNLKGPNTRAAFAAAFGGGTTTRSNLLALQAGPNQDRATELGIADVGDGHLASARQMMGG